MTVHPGIFKIVAWFGANYYLPLKSLANAIIYQTANFC